MLPVDYVSGARRDFDESFDWYAERSIQAALRFVTAVDAAIAKIAADPTHFASPDGIHRECPVKKFPFRIVYRVVENRIVVMAIAHAKRRPGYWRDRA
jgi:plasmid stabilization system protein ParE